MRYEKTLAELRPDLAAEWHSTKNGALTPYSVTPGSTQKVWWKCEKGHEWEAIISSRNRGSNCPYCFGQKVVRGVNDLATINPKLAAEWHPTKNGYLTPADVMSGSNKKVWWRCEKGHEWETVIANRSAGYGCPVCCGRKAWSGFNDLLTKNPDLAVQWHPTLNGDLTPADVTYSSGKKVWWLCDKGHEWQATVNSRNTGNGCPYCAGNTVLLGGNDLATKSPELVKQWHPTKNGDLTPSNVAYKSGEKVWWLCENGHEWEAVIANRSNGTGCPHCYNERRKIIEQRRKTP